MPEQAQKLLHFTDNVLKPATEESEALARELEADYEYDGVETCAADGTA